MKYSKSSVLFTSLALSSAAVRALKTGDKQGRSAETASSSLWDYFGYNKNQAALVVSADTKGERDEPWMLVTEDEDDFAFTEEPLAKDEIKTFHQQMKDEAVKRYDEDRLARVKQAEEDEALRAWAVPHEPKMAAKWHQRAAPVLEVGEAIMVYSDSDDEPSHEQIMQMFNAEAAVLVEDEPNVEDLQPEVAEDIPDAPPMDEDVIPDAPPMDEDEIPDAPPTDEDEIPDAPAMDAAALQAPVSAAVNDIQEPNKPGIFRGKQVQQMGFANSNESPVSAEEVALIQRFEVMFQNAPSREHRDQVVNSMEQAIKENPKFAELFKRQAQLSLQVRREVIENEQEDEEEYDFD